MLTTLTRLQIGFVGMKGDDLALLAAGRDNLGSHDACGTLEFLSRSMEILGWVLIVLASHVGDL